MFESTFCCDVTLDVIDVSADATPATFETPDVAPKQTPKPSDGKDDTSQRPADAAGSEDDGPTHNPEPAKSMLTCLNV